MARFEKTYIGKGSKIKDLDIVRLSITRETLEEILNNHLVDYEGKNTSSLKWLLSRKQTSTRRPMRPISAKRRRILEL